MNTAPSQSVELTATLRTTDVYVCRERVTLLVRVGSRVGYVAYP